MSWDQELALAKQAALEAGHALLAWSSGDKQVLSQEGRDIKTLADQDAERIILARLGGSGYPILAEESGATGILEGDGPFWVVDPLDGTLNFKRGFPLCSVSIALMRGRTPLLGVVYDFFRDECFAGVPGQGATLNDAPLRVSGVTDPKQGVLVTGFPTKSDHSEAGVRAVIERIQRFKKVRMLGSAALMLAYVAAGRADAYAEDDIMLWDIAAGLALVQAAGGYSDLRESDRVEWGVHIRCAANEGLWK
jgi:myo-inositol-1(or 4)-monophosphatase